MDNAELMAIARDVEHTTLDPAAILVTDRVAVVTGGGGGIGQGVALGLARFGADVAVLDVVPQRCAATEAALRRLGRRALGIPCDVSDAEEIRSALARVVRELGQVDILVNNAGGVRSVPFLEMSERSMRRHLDINLMSLFVATQEAARSMIAGGRGGAVVNVSSIEGARGAPTFAVYAACKAATMEFTRTMALELAEHGIRVNCIAPDHTITPGGRGNRTGPVDPSSWAETSDDWAKLVPLGREGLVEECASTVVWLCSRMSEYVTGVTVHVDGGTWASSGWLRRPEGGWTLNP